MSRGINLLASHKKFLEQEKRVGRLVRAVSFVLLVAYLLIAFAVSSFWLYTRKTRENIEEQITVKKQRIVALKNIESLHALIKQRLVSLKLILDEDAAEYVRLLDYFEQFPPSEIFLEDIVIFGDGQVEISGEATDSRCLADFVKKISETDGSGLFSQAVLASLSRTREGTYSFNIDLQERF